MGLAVADVVTNNTQDLAAASVQLANQGPGVLLADAVAFHDKSPAGLSEILTGMVKLTDGLYSTQYDNLHIIFSGKYPPNPVELLGGKYFPMLLEETRKVYDYVLVDTPPLGQVIDAAVLTPFCDGTLLVMESHCRLWAIWNWIGC